ncbi:hypothetical protein [Roseomonas xinghualingensis]|uniref:hypothetical protein n=1 Tax=Roseomonas xinghualingensis TaxID=2986475 RepID=UPI0021F1E924|nr:hypothetical protein [Roseomonas sp. SXEYE001]MCV4208439.1 hypothetical protein [Roseomonas sp. SXEYE001]
MSSFSLTRSMRILGLATVLLAPAAMQDAFAATTPSDTTVTIQMPRPIARPAQPQGQRVNPLLFLEQSGATGGAGQGQGSN